MATPEPPSPSALAFPGVLRSPSKDNNTHGHPYPIKTTSTAILSRSNSLSGRSQIPLVYNSTSNVKPLGRSQSRGHGRANSLSNAAPQPLPLPSKRRDSYSSAQSVPVPLTPKPEAIAQLPDNPKQWTPSQLSIYLSSALRFKSGGAIPAAVAKDIAALTLREKLTGKTFLKMSDESFAALGINKLWREALLSASRTLRKKVLKGRIWGFGSTDGELEDGTPAEPSKRRIPSTVEEEASLPATPPSAGYRGGRVRGMIESLERSTSSTGSGGSDEGDIENQTLNDERLESELKAAGLWINDEAEGEDDLSGNLSASSSSDNEMIEDYHSRNSSMGSQPPAYTSAAPVDASNEPSIAELLAQDPALGRGTRHTRQDGTFEEAPSWGAMAWENDADIIGGTAKKIAPVQANAQRPIKPGVISGAPQPNIHNMFGSVDNATESERGQQYDGSQTLLDAFKVRLEAMEERLKELEHRDEEREKELVVFREKEKKWLLEEEKRLLNLKRPTLDLSPEPDPYAAVVDEDDPVDIPWPRPVRQPLLSDKLLTPLVIPGEKTQPLFEEPQPVETEVDHKQSTTAHEDPPLEDIVDPAPSELPAYVLLVSFGVAAVVARVLFRRIGGGRRF